MSDELHTHFASTDIPTLIAHLEALIATNKETPNHRMHSHHALQFFERADIPAKARVATLLGQYHVLAYNSPSPTPAMEAIQLLNEAITGTPVTQSLAASTPDVVRASVAVYDTRVVLFRHGSELLHGRAADFPSFADECAVFDDVSNTLQNFTVWEGIKELPLHPRATVHAAAPAHRRSRLGEGGVHWQ